MARTTLYSPSARRRAGLATPPGGPLPADTANAAEAAAAATSQPGLPTRPQPVGAPQPQPMGASQAPGSVWVNPAQRSRIPAGPGLPDPTDPPGTQAATAARANAGRGWRQALRRHERWVWAAGALLLAGAVAWPSWNTPRQRALGLPQIDAALRESLAKEPLPAATLAAYQAISPSVVRVVAEPAGPPDKNGKPDTRPPATLPEPQVLPQDDDDLARGRSVGTGVVIVDSGLILTNLHVVQGAARIRVNFADGSESEAVVVNVQPENDLAVLQARVLPDDLKAATMRSTQGLSPGDTVVAVGFPFGIGPSATAGVVSGLGREFRSPKGQRILTNLIQFDAAANPGNSGGPLVTQDGHVVGIVTAIMNPEGHSTFIGIGFAVPIENAAAAAGMPPF